MKIAVTGGTGFLGRYIVNQLASAGHDCRCWYRPQSNRDGFDHGNGIEWQQGDLTQPDSFEALCTDVDAVVHSALYRPTGMGFRASAQDAFDEFVRVNLLGSLQLMQTAFQKQVSRFIFISTCAVHEIILDDRTLDEAHPLWATNHYGAHKAAIEKFVHSFGLGQGWNVCALRPTGIYGTATPAENSRWFQIVKSVANGTAFNSNRGGKEVHAADVAQAVQVLLQADARCICGQAFNCYDQYISEKRVAELAREISGSHAAVGGENHGPKNQIATDKLRSLGMAFGGDDLLRATIAELVTAARDEK